MILRSLYLHNFRIYDEAFFEFCPRVNIICGPNACGKSTILEAIHFLAFGRSFRTIQTKDMIRKGAKFFYVEASFIKHGVEQKLRISSDGKERKIIYNSTPCSSATSLLGLLQIVAITPDDAALVKGSPVGRRHFLDLQIAQVDPLYVHLLTRYNRAMRQRNYLLRAKNPSTIESWEHEMANAAAYIYKQRSAAAKDLQEKGRKLYRALSNEDSDLTVTYKAALPEIKEDAGIMAYYLQQYAKLRSREMVLGYSLTGPHKDDLAIEVGKGEARFFASEGQQRSIVAAMHMAEWERLNALAGVMPLLLVDDVGISLDDSRKEKMYAHVGGLGQVFLTSTHDLPIQLPDAERKTLQIKNLEC